MTDRLRIAIIDDDPTILNVLNRVLSDHSLCTYRSVEEFKSKCHEERGSGYYLYDVVMTDLELPGESGLELIRELKENNYTGCTILMTGNYGNLTQDERSMPSYCISKPFEIDYLLEILNKIIQPQSPASQA